MSAKTPTLSSIPQHNEQALIERLDKATSIANNALDLIASMKDDPATVEWVGDQVDKMYQRLMDTLSTPLPRPIKTAYQSMVDRYAKIRATLAGQTLPDIDTNVSLMDITESDLRQIINSTNSDFVTLTDMHAKFSNNIERQRLICKVLNHERNYTQQIRKNYLSDDDTFFTKELDEVLSRVAQFEIQQCSSTPGTRLDWQEWQEGDLAQERIDLYRTSNEINDPNLLKAVVDRLQRWYSREVTKPDSVPISAMDVELKFKYLKAVELEFQRQLTAFRAEFGHIKTFKTKMLAFTKACMHAESVRAIEEIAKGYKHDLKILNTLTKF